MVYAHETSCRTPIESPKGFHLEAAHHLQNYLADHALGLFRPYDLPRLILPILDHIEQQKPDIVIACDRGARLAGLAIFSAWRQTRTSRFPTLDNKLHFARLSAAEDMELGQQRIDRIIDSSLQSTQSAKDEQLHVLFVDDWVVRGNTKEYAQMLLEKHGASSEFVTLCGKRSDLSVTPHVPVWIGSVLTMWRNNPDQLGVVIADRDDPRYSTIGLAPISTPRSRTNRRMINAGSRALS